MAMRSSWEGYLKLNLLSVPVKAYTTSVGGHGRISFHQIHADCGERIRHQKVCPVHGEVSKDEVISGYEYAKGEYVTVEPEELNKLRRVDDKAITIDVFVAPDAIPPVYRSGRTYYLTPDGKVGQKPYAVLNRVMTEQQRNAVARVVFSGRLQVALIEPLDDLLLMSLLNFHDQVKQPGSFKDEVDEPDLSKKEIELAESLVEASTESKFDLAAYHDEYEAELSELIAAKSKGKRIADRRGHGGAHIINLMDALKKSLNQKHKAPVRRARRKTG